MDGQIKNEVHQPSSQDNGEGNRAIATTDDRGHTPSNHMGEDDLSQEEKEIREVTTQFTNAPKFARWRELYFDQHNQFNLKTFHNPTLSAIYAYDLDINSVKDRTYASNLGYRNTKKCEGWARQVLEAEGTTPELVIKAIAMKALSPKSSPKFMEMLASITDVYNPKAASIVNNTQINNTQVNVDGKAQEDFNKQFKEWVNSQ